VGLEASLTKLASRRNLQDLTIGPVLSVTTETFEAHRDALLKVGCVSIVSFFSLSSLELLPYEFFS